MVLCLVGFFSQIAAREKAAPRAGAVDRPVIPGPPPRGEGPADTPRLKPHRPRGARPRAPSFGYGKACRAPANSTDPTSAPRHRGAVSGDQPRAPLRPNQGSRNLRRADAERERRLAPYASVGCDRTRPQHARPYQPSPPCAVLQSLPVAQLHARRNAPSPQGLVHHNRAPDTVSASGRLFIAYAGKASARSGGSRRALV